MPLSVFDDHITLKYGAGGLAMRTLIQQVFLDGAVRDRADGEIDLSAMDDGAALRVGDRWLVVTTDSHVIHPIFFPGGDIGRLAVSGTVNDLAMMGATEVLALTCAVIIEEGFSRSDLVKIQRSIREACDEAGAAIVAGDTKVMGKGELDGIVLNTTGIALTDRVVPDSGLRPGDRLIVTGTLGDHGMAVMAGRHGLALDGDLRSDVAPLNGLVRAVLNAVPGGVVAILDSPFYRRSADGEAMVREKHQLAAQRFEQRAPSLLGLPHIEFLTGERLADASEPLALAWARHRVRYPLWYELRPVAAFLRRARAPSRFDVWTARIR